MVFWNLALVAILVGVGAMCLSAGLLADRLGQLILWLLGKDTGFDRRLPFWFVGAPAGIILGGWPTVRAKDEYHSRFWPVQCPWLVRVQPQNHDISSI